jgi:hypothetical protein
MRKNEKSVLGKIIFLRRGIIKEYKNTEHEASRCSSVQYLAIFVVRPTRPTLKNNPKAYEDARYSR